MTWVTTIYLKNTEIWTEARKICADIAKKDPNFTYKIEKLWLKIFSSTKDLAMRRGLLFVKKYLSGDLGFEVSYEKEE